MPLPDSLAGHRVGRSTGIDERTADDWAAALPAASAFSPDAVELFVHGPQRLADLLRYLSANADALAVFGYVSLHAPILDSAGAWGSLADDLGRLPTSIKTIVVHADTANEADLARLRRLGPRLCFENMDCQKSDGRFVAELDRVFQTCPESCLCLDVAHVLTLDPSLRLAFELLDAFGHRLRQLHVSGIHPDGTHQELAADQLELFAPVLERCPAVPVILESFVTEPATSARD